MATPVSISIPHSHIPSPSARRRHRTVELPLPQPSHYIPLPSEDMVPLPKYTSLLELTETAEVGPFSQENPKSIHVPAVISSPNIKKPTKEHIPPPLIREKPKKRQMQVDTLLPLQKWSEALESSKSVHEKTETSPEEKEFKETAIATLRHAYAMNETMAAKEYFNMSTDPYAKLTFKGGNLQIDKYFSLLEKQSHFRWYPLALNIISNLGHILRTMQVERFLNMKPSWMH